MSDAGKTTVEPITPERVERDRARMLAMAEFFMTASESLLCMHNAVPPGWSPTRGSTSPPMMHEKLQALSTMSASLVDRGVECARVAALCFEAATRKEGP